MEWVKKASEMVALTSVASFKCLFIFRWRQNLTTSQPSLDKSGHYKFPLVRFTAGCRRLLPFFYWTRNL